MNTDIVTDLVIAVEFYTSLLNMIAAGHYDWVNPDITTERFPIESTATKEYRTKLFHFDRPISSEDAVAAMKKEDFTPATHVHGLAFGATFPGEQLK
jgi:hypothetical protein